MNPQVQHINHSLNTSYCKYAYKFSTSKRFQTPRKIKTQFTYEIKQALNKNGMKFPCSKRVALSKNNEFPSPNSYSIGSLQQFQRNNKLRHIRGGVIGLGRQVVRFKSLISQCDKKAYLPSPNTYEVPNSIKEKNISLRIRLPTQLQIKLKKAQTPGPGQYKVTSMNQNGKYSVSNIKNVRKVFLDGQKRYPQFQNISMSPDKYQTQKVKNFRQTVISFTKGKRKEVVDKFKKSIPGPGMYETFSQFGNASRQIINKSKENDY